MAAGKGSYSLVITNKEQTLAAVEKDEARDGEEESLRVKKQTGSVCVCVCRGCSRGKQPT